MLTHTQPAYSPAHSTFTPPDKTLEPAVTRQLNHVGKLAAHPPIGQSANSHRDAELRELLKLLGTLVVALKTWMSKDAETAKPQPPMTARPTPSVSSPHRPLVNTLPVPNTVSTTKNEWKEQLAPFMNRPNLASIRNAFDTELIEMFSDKNHEPITAFMSEKPKGQKPDDLRNGLRATYENFPYLGTRGREEHVAAIKVAMATFGQSPAGIFKHVAKHGDHYDVTMRDGFKLTITVEELELAAKAAKFSGGDEGMVKDAQFLFAVMSKRQYLELERDSATDPFMSLYGKDSAYHAHRTYPGVLSGAGGGIDGDTALSYLGLEEHLQVIDARALGTQVGVPLDKGARNKNGVIIEGVMEGQLYNTPVSPSLKVVTLRG
ncbi:MAG TPA: type III secretion protein [Pseudomonas lactis]|uniref:Type III secretion protein n=1 Tax=Pseudomonas lactis TaxID=1615674 RepID=A0A921T945_9PSED|nr:type III secretion protein [Pseudomonas lactis]HJH20609.1 type III secretion protein [Pseudomonas lactis]